MLKYINFFFFLKVMLYFRRKKINYWIILWKVIKYEKLYRGLVKEKEKLGSNPIKYLVRVFEKKQRNIHYNN